jgi:UDPglucose 6-dehydrogenase
MSYAKSAYEAVQGADALVLLTEWSEYRRPNFDKIKSLMRGRAIFDLRNQYGRDVVEKAGFFYECVGRPSFGAAGR